MIIYRCDHCGEHIGNRLRVTLRRADGIEEHFCGIDCATTWAEWAGYHQPSDADPPIPAEIHTRQDRRPAPRLGLPRPHRTRPAQRMGGDSVSLDVEWEAQDEAWNVYADVPIVTMTAQEVMEIAECGDMRSWATELKLLWMHDRYTVLRVLDSVAAEGFRTPIIIGPDGRLWDGHHRLAVALALGTAVPVRRIPKGRSHA